MIDSNHPLIQADATKDSETPMVTKELKYQLELKESSCALTDFKEYGRRTAYRWVFEDILDARNFLPIYALDKEKLTNHKLNGGFSCTCWAISFYKSEVEAKEKYDKIISKSPKAYKKLGTHVARGVLNSLDGISGECDDIGHFNHFEYKGVQLENKFSVKSCLITL